MLRPPNNVLSLPALGVAMVAICGGCFLISNWHIRSLGKLRKNILIEDRAILLAQV
jgi:hypothetical protein